MDKKERERFFKYFNQSFVTDSNLFWKICKAFFSNKRNYRSQMKLVENDKVLQDDMVARELHERFKNLVSTLNVSGNIFLTNRTLDDVIIP